MSTFQLFLLIIAAAVMYMFFKQLLSGKYPKRGVDFEAKKEDEQIGGISRPDKTFSRPKVKPTRMEQLMTMADEAVEKKDYEEAKKALGAALIIDDKNVDVLQKMAYVSMQSKDYEEAKESYEKLLALDENDDMAHVLLANTLHKLGDDENAEKHHEKAILIDPEYAPHHFNYANTLYDLGRLDEALIGYKKAYELDNTLEDAKGMITEIENKNV
ncbi:O-linked GlcNAc transferase [hydrothermal vent metagenome]|uniref:O-linked GlcNAc transferase n=1 Tax=hydrothermal vent metagenome TaxID=652676 RepID=A0A1W1EFY2_9ZZZZ